MKPRKFMKNNWPNLKNKIIKDLPNTFDSHQFITQFAKEFDSDYNNFLKFYTENQYRKVHSQIAIGLIENMEYLEIKKNGKVKSLNIFGINSENEQWIKI